MCIKPLRIANRSHYISPNGGKPYVEVPCGKCKECRASQANEWTLRIYSEYLKNARQNWRSKEDNWHSCFTYFETLTYSERDVPRFHGFRCFSTEHIKKFRDHLRKRIIRFKNKHGIEIFAPFYKEGFKLICVSEYGGLTHRPHYHLLFHINIPNLSVWLLRKFIRDCWPYGFVDRDESILDRLVDGIGVMKYISNYVKKDDDFVYDLENKIQELKKSNPRFELRKKEKRALLPFHVQSQHYGSAILDLFSKQELFEKGFIQFPDGPLCDQTFEIPLYIQRQDFIYKNVPYRGNPLDKSGHIRKRYALTQLGRDFKSYHFDTQIDRLSEQLESLHQQMQFFVNPDNNQRYVYLFDIVKNALNNQLINYKDLATYQFVYRGVCTDDSHIDIFGNATKPFYECTAKEFYYNRLVSSDICHYVNNKFDEYQGSLSNLYHHQLLSLIYHDKSIEDILNQIYDFREIVRSFEQKSYIKRLQDISRHKLISHSWLLPKIYKNINSLNNLQLCTKPVTNVG